MVNVKNYEADSTPNDIISAIFEKQKELLFKYKDVEGMTCLDSTGAVKSISDPQAQKILKDFAWRIAEELCEMYDCLENKEHAREEVADALHFLVELMILSGVNQKDFHTAWQVSAKRDCVPLGLNDATVSFIVEMGNAMNCLKCKPWKVTQVLTDEDKYRERLRLSFILFFNITDSLGMNEKDIWEYYSKKNKVNSFRIETKY